jgi:hypothetical protein
MAYAAEVGRLCAKLTGNGDNANRTEVWIDQLAQSLPHTREDAGDMGNPISLDSSSAPHARGRHVIPYGITADPTRLPHTRADAIVRMSKILDILRSAPRAQGKTVPWN